MNIKKRFRPTLTTTVVLATSLTLARNGCSAQDSVPFASKATWHESYQASLAALVAMETKEEEEAKAAEKQLAAEGEPGLGPWYYIGLFSNENQKGFETAYPPEKEIDLNKAYKGRGDKEVRWHKGIQFKDNTVNDLLPTFGPSDWAIAYLYRTITVKQAQKLPIYLGSDDGLAVFLNGETVLAKNPPRGCAPDQDMVTLSLKAGENQLLLKIINHTGGFGFYFALKPGASQDQAKGQRHEQRSQAIWARVQGECRDPVSRREMTWEAEDSIWTRWTPDNLPELARRYQAAANSRLTQAQRRAEELKQDGLANAAAKVGDVLTTASEQSQVLAKESLEGQESVSQWRVAYHRARNLGARLDSLARLVSTRLAVLDLVKTFAGKYPGDQLLARLDTLEKSAVDAALGKDEARDTDETSFVWDRELGAVQQEALVLRNPLLQFEKLLFVRRTGPLGLPQNWQGNSSIARTGYGGGICILSAVRADGKVTVLYETKGPFVGDLDLSFDGQRLLFSMPSKQGRFEVWEIGADGSGLRQVTNDKYGFDNYDACYLPDGNIMFCSSRCVQAVPCTGGDHVALLYLMDRDGQNVRQITFDQDHSWNPTVMNDGRVLYGRWEYNDLPHYFSRLLFICNPDGTGQMEYYGSNSWFPNSMFYARPIPGDTQKVVSVLTGHHGWPRMGEVAILDPGNGRHEASGVVRILPQRHRKIEAVQIDQYATGEYPTFVAPYPLSDKYFLVSCQPNPQTPWGLYLVDVFDNLVPVYQEPDANLFEPIPLRARPIPQVIPPRVNYKRKDAVVQIVDIYRGPGLAGVQRGTIRKLRIVEPVYRYWGNGETHSCARDGTWDVKKIHGTVPVYEDGSASFRVPANTPLMIQPLNEEGMAQQLMRSWMTAMPGENVTCVGCHERQNDAPLNTAHALASKQPPVAITPWYGPPRGFSFEKEVQPVLDKHCVSCHHGQEQNGKRMMDFRGKEQVPGYDSPFSPAYDALHPFVRRCGLESDINLLTPREFEANTSPLIQMLRKGHNRVALSPEDWDRLITWIDLNVPYAGSWEETRQKPPAELVKRREEMQKVDEDTRRLLADRGQH